MNGLIFFPAKIARTKQPQKTFFQPKLTQKNSLYNQLVKSLELEGVDLSQHHIFPKAQINILLTRALVNNRALLRTVIEKHVNNNPKIKQSILEKIKQPNMAMEDVYSSIIWHKNNLILGPTNRSDDEHGPIDQKLLKSQNNNWKIKFQEMKDKTQNEPSIALKKFLQFTQPINVKWEKDNNANTYRVTSPTQERKGIEGYTY